ncbi:MAG: SMC-Scp complex subunit ScpB, partial [Candidatus Avelusimicrobium sp.]|uniref:SMC-Scp complex subunit ScpB n=1 Tax=Candidatus Avelusimicrobium sp. TaxID=3048833 RepID=UPI003F018E91
GRWVRRLYNEKMTTKLSNAALETLAIVAYKQPITRAEMEAIRGVDVAGPLERLLERALVRVVGKKDTVGRPMVYGTTDEFLRMFGLNKISELPDLQVFAAKTLHEKQEDLPFGEPLPPIGEPAIIPLEELEGEEKLEALDSSAADPFFTRNSYNRGDFFTPGTLEESAPAAGQDEASAHAQEEVTADNELAALQTARGEEKQQSETGAAAEERTNQEEN